MQWDWTRVFIIVEALIVLVIMTWTAYSALKAARKVNGVREVVFKGRACIAISVALFSVYAIETAVENWNEPITPRVMWIQIAFVFAVLARTYFSKYELKEGFDEWQ
jgi:phosphatidylglycerophosphate synthase